MNERFIVIGITDSPTPFFPPEVREVIRQGMVFSGGRRHHEIVASELPTGHRWIDITVPLDDVFAQYEALPADSEVIVFASGDPLFFGFASTIRQRCPAADIKVYPAFNSLQMLAHRLVMPYADMRIVSLTGRPWQAFDRALIERTAMMGVLTDRQHTPTAIARRMLTFGYRRYTMFVGEHLGHPEKERVTKLSIEEAAQREFAMPNCLILRAHDDVGTVGAKPFGLPDERFSLLDGREKMITKMPIRLLTLQALDLPARRVLWDIGFCTGSVSIEARQLFPHLLIEAFEIRPECEAIITDNMQRMGVPGIEVHIGDFLSTDCSALPTPDAVFIGGHGGRLKEIMAKAVRHLNPGGIIVMNSVVAPKVTTDSHQLWDEACREQHLRQDDPMHIQINDHHPITILKCKR